MRCVWWKLWQSFRFQMGSLSMSVALAVGVGASREFQRLRFRSGVYPGDIPDNCGAASHRPQLHAAEAHPLRKAVAVEFYASPLGLSRPAFHGDSPLTKPELYAADHLRYSRGGGLWAFRWLEGHLVDAGNDVAATIASPPSGARRGTDKQWLARALTLLVGARAVVDASGGTTPLHLGSWAFDPGEWADALLAGWQEGIFSALVVLSDVLCHRLVTTEEIGTASLVNVGRLPIAPRCLGQSPREGPSEFVGECLPHAAVSVLGEAEGVAGAMVPALRLAWTLVQGCSMTTASGISGWRAVWRQLVDFRPGGAPKHHPMNNVPRIGEIHGDCPVEQVSLSRSEATPWATTLSMRLCSNHPHSALVGNGNETVHILGVSLMHVGGPDPEACVVLEVVLFATSNDACYITQASSHYRTLPYAFIADWRCSIGVGPAASAASVSATGSVVSAFGTDAVVRCGFRAGSLPLSGVGGAVGGPLLHLHLTSRAWHVEGIKLCAEEATAWGQVEVGEESPRRRAGTDNGGEAVPASAVPGSAVPHLPRLALLAHAREPPPRLITVCTTVLFDAGRRLDGVGVGPPLLLQWLQYHMMLGIDHFVVYDSDGSAAEIVAPHVATGTITYFPKWPSRLSQKLEDVSRTPHCRKCLSAQAEAHCLWLSRGLSRWVLSLHSFDAYLGVAQGRDGSASSGLQHVVTVVAPLLAFEPERRRIGTIALPMLDFGGEPSNTSWLLGRFRHRARQPVSVVGSKSRGNPRPNSWLNHMGVTLRNPENVLGVLDHFARSRPGTVDVEVPPEVMRVNHYVDAFGPRCASHFIPCDTPDGGLLRALPVLCKRVGLPGCCAEQLCGS